MRGRSVWATARVAALVLLCSAVIAGLAPSNHPELVIAAPTALPIVGTFAIDPTPPSTTTTTTTEPPPVTTTALTSDSGVGAPAPSGDDSRQEQVLRSAPAPVDVGAFLACVRQREGGGNYSINTGNGYFGTYQFLQSTWNATAAHAGRPDLIGVHASDASSADQDAMALALYDWQGAAPWAGGNYAC